MSLINNFLNNELMVKLSEMYEDLIVKQNLDAYVFEENSEDNRSVLYDVFLDSINADSNLDYNTNRLLAVSNFMYYIKSIHDKMSNSLTEDFLSQYFDNGIRRDAIIDYLPSMCTRINARTDFKYANSDTMKKLKQFTDAATAFMNTIEAHSKNLIIMNNKRYIEQFNSQIVDAANTENLIMDTCIENQIYYKEITKNLVNETDSLKDAYKNYSEVLNTVSKNYDDRKALLIDATQELERNSEELSDTYKTLVLTELSLDYDSQELINALLARKTTNVYDEQLASLTSELEGRNKHLEELKTQFSDISISRDEIEILKAKRKSNLLLLMRVDLENNSKSESDISSLYNSILSSDHVARIDSIEYNLIPINELNSLGITKEASVPVETVLKNIDNEIKSLTKSVAKKTNSTAALDAKDAEKDFLRSEIQKETFNLANNEEQINAVSALKEKEDAVIAKNNAEADKLLHEFTDKYSDIYKNDLKYIISSFNRISDIYSSVGVESDLTVNTNSPECNITEYSDVIAFTNAIKNDISEKYRQLTKLNTLVKDEESELFKETISGLNAKDEAALKEARDNFKQSEERYNNILPIAALVAKLSKQQHDASRTLDTYWHQNRLLDGKHSETTTAFIQDIVANADMIQKANHTNSSQYTNMINAATEIFNPKGELSKLKDTDFESYKDKISMLKEQTEKYINEKNKQFRPFPSSQRKFRLAFANDLLSICNDYLDSFNGLEAYTDEEKSINANKIDNPVIFVQKVFKSEKYNIFALNYLASESIRMEYDKSVKATEKIINSNEIKSKDKFDFYDLSTENGKTEQVTAQAEHSKASKEKGAITKTN